MAKSDDMINVMTSRSGGGRPRPHPATAAGTGRRQFDSRRQKIENPPEAVFRIPFEDFVEGSTFRSGNHARLPVSEIRRSYFVS